MNAQFWQKKRVLITGHTGFKGSWLSLWLHQLGAEVHGYALPSPTVPSLFELAHIDDCVSTTIGDIRDLSHFRDTLNSVRPEIVLHLAAQPLVRESYITPVETFSTNVMGTIHVLESIRHTPGIRSVVIVTSDKCYENQESGQYAYREEDPMGGYDPYSCSKGATELVTSSYRRSFFQNSATSIASVRAGNVIGGGDFSQDRLIPDLVRAIEHNTSITIRNPHAIRPWQFVLEPLSGYMTLAQRLYEDGQVYAEGWNFGPTDSDVQSVSQIVATFNRFIKHNNINPVSIELQAASNALHEAGFLRLDISKAKQHLDWTPRITLDTALKLTAQWYADYLKHGNVRELCENQIDFFGHLK